MAFQIAHHCSGIKPFRTLFRTWDNTLRQTTVLLPFILTAVFSSFFNFFCYSILMFFAAAENQIIRWYLSMALLWRKTPYSLFGPLHFHFASHSNANECSIWVQTSSLLALSESSFPDLEFFLRSYTHTETSLTVYVSKPHIRTGFAMNHHRALDCTTTFQDRSPYQCGVDTK